jgi:hypothetical protein
MFPGLERYRQSLTGGRGWNSIRAGVARFFEDAGDIHFRHVHLRTFVEEHPAVLDGVAGPDAVVDQLKRLQRVFLVAPRYEHVEALMGAGLHSAFAIAAIPYANFIRDFGGEPYAANAYSSAQHCSALTSNVSREPPPELLRRERSGGPR